MSLSPTGERFLPELRGAIRWEHIHRYLFARELVAGREVLDAASGEGYGSKILAGRARRVMGVDIAEDAVAHARRIYAGDNLSFTRGDCRALPLGDGVVDVVVSFETIEHVADPGCVLGEFHRVLRPDGLLVVSSPERNRYPAGNPFHLGELTAAELTDQLQKHFKHVALYGQRMVAGSCLFPMDGSRSRQVGVWDDHEGGQVFADGMNLPVYMVALASDGPLPEPITGVFDNADESRRLWNLFDQDYASVCAELDAVRHSKSWRLTAPLRQLRRWLGRPKTPSLE